MGGFAKCIVDRVDSERAVRWRENRLTCTNPPPELRDARGSFEEEKMRHAFAVGRAEAAQGDHGAGHRAQGCRPLMFQGLRVMRVPHFDGCRGFPEEIDVPVRGASRVQVVTQPPSKSSGAECGANVYVVPLARGQPAEPANLNPALSQCPEDEGIRSGARILVNLRQHAPPALRSLSRTASRCSDWLLRRSARTPQ